MRDFQDETPGTLLYFRFSVASNGTQGNGNSDNPDATCDCLVALYESLAINLLGLNGDTNGIKDVFEALSPQGDFIRGDADNNGNVNIADATFIGSFLSAGGATPACLDAADTNNDGVINNTDVVFLSNFLMHCDTNPPPPAPFPACGVDTVGDALTCSEHDCTGSFVCTP